MEKLAALLASRDQPLSLDRTRFAAEMEHLLKTPGYTTDKSVLTMRGLEEFKMSKKAEEDQPSEEELALILMCEEISEALSKAEETFMLSSPMTLTVKKPNGSYSKVAHIGSEDFSPHSAYLGKKGKIIFVFKPVMVGTDYTHMEMEEQQAVASLMGFKEWLRENVGDTQAKLRDIRQESAKKAEQEKLADRFETYKDLGFGTW
jgi:hypothetical protein